jgi:hypothetical protein
MAATIAEKVQEVIGRVLTEPAFAAQVQQDGLAALKSGLGSPEWDAYFEHFASTPGELAAKGATLSAAACTCNSNTVITLSTVVSPIPTCCGATTTTTTSGG